MSHLNGAFWIFFFLHVRDDLLIVRLVGRVAGILLRIFLIS